MNNDSEKTRLVRRQDSTRLVRKGAGLSEDANADGVKHAPGEPAPVSETVSEPKTRILGIEEPKAPPTADPASAAAGAGSAATPHANPPRNADPVVGFVIVVDGPGRGQFRGVFNGMNSIGRGNDQRIPVNFGDETISRSEHAYIIYDDEGRTFFVQHGGRANLVRLNGKPVLQSVPLEKGDKIRIGKSELKFLPFCGEEFDWGEEASKQA